MDLTRRLWGVGIVRGVLQDADNFILEECPRRMLTD
jgi:hypothetical protein